MAARSKALITGASAGIGVAYAEALARQGCDVVLLARRRDRLEALASRLQGEHAISAEVLVADLAEAADIERVAKRLTEDEALTHLVNNAGFGGYRPFAELEPHVADALIDVHIRATVHLTRAALPGMLARKRGAIINVASLLALSGSVPTNPLPYRAVYAGAKAFLVTFTQTLAGEVQGSGVRLQVCVPGLVATEFHAVQGVERPAPGMTAEELVAGSLLGLERDEVVCIPGLGDPRLFARVDAAQREVMSAANSGGLAARYR
jgi:short-subunit dehydrogenase